jgi:hypothetical protein
MTQILPLPPLARIEARAAARQLVIATHGQPPTRDQSHINSKYPRAANLFITGLALLMLIATFAISAMRLYEIGSTTFGFSIADRHSQAIAGLAIVMMAETGQVIFSLALAILANTRPARIVLYASMTIATAIALTGNIQLAMPGHWHNPFAYLESIAPPLLVLGTAYVLKGQILIAIALQYEREQKYQEERAKWENTTRSPEQSVIWPIHYANSLRSALIQFNNRGRGATERRQIMTTLTDQDWSNLVRRELRAERWFETTGDETQPIMAITPDALEEQTEPRPFLGDGARATRSGE